MGAFLFASCASTQQAGNLSYADVSLNFSSDEFDVVTLAPVSASAKSFFGISENVNESSILDRSEFEAGTTWGIFNLCCRALGQALELLLHMSTTITTAKQLLSIILISAVGIGIAGIMKVTFRGQMPPKQRPSKSARPIQILIVLSIRSTT